MARNFRISVSHRDPHCVRLRLAGDFDGTSAYGLINRLKDYVRAQRRIVIDTDGLRSVYPFGVAVFNKFNPSNKKMIADIRFTGTYSPTFDI